MSLVSNLKTQEFINKLEKTISDSLDFISRSGPEYSLVSGLRELICLHDNLLIPEYTSVSQEKEPNVVIP